ncbi:cysteine/glutathione ABC transporter permease/ATP-binding protein CydD [Edwardsiella piscicida]|uniref:heme ABC transporter permease/ATP-binding protein CydD n=1 Tax=Edwardsiella piscicida TaxID=1263550 RepID=UPI00054CB466|nr:cysteine/glutathione ABC transporter permease/ATP-binding protein CydD [Edwardsiella piscicida]ELM3659431.1 cysteine/glutathione ABC transporter permease/ATP-binding protein CydD [Edwardsiella piscicida]ELM3737533.1 cysteine/glutathione ABC transporter permease/ATP-binding protein CydD [Edwardsiella piscicida]WGS75863.1 cysteine/glutathione ABC transporter permease/ATP-binding protein CydD [Edwardsiella piscicida]WGS79252.1 cysteine/glutathione ABC transporter permease/ATP-binding protein Cy
MNKQRQRELTQWLKQRSRPAQRWLRLSMLLGLLSGLLIIAQSWLLATLLQRLIIDHTPRGDLVQDFALLIVAIALRALLGWLRERVGFRCGQVVRREIRALVLNRLAQLGPVWIQEQPAGHWATLILEQIEEMQDFYARYLPQMALAVTIPLLILAAVFPINWAAGLILFATAPLIPLFMALVGMGAADANRRNFLALSRLSANFLDRLRGMETLRLFHRARAETQHIAQASEDFRKRTMEVLRLAFLSSAVLEFFASVSIAVVAVYFGFSYLGELNFGHYDRGVTLFAGFLVLILAPEFFQPLRDLGTFYHAKAQAIGAAEALVTFLDASDEAQLAPDSAATADSATVSSTVNDRPLTLEAHNLEILSPQGKVLAGPLNFRISAGERIALVGYSGAGKSSLINLLLGFLPYRGELLIDGQPLSDLPLASWRRQLAWVGQNPTLPLPTLRANILLGAPQADDAQLQSAVERAYVDEFLPLLPQGLDTPIGEDAARLSVGQAQRVAVARALIRPCRLLLLDEPTASLDANSERLVMRALQAAARHQTTLMVTHQLDELAQFDRIWVMEQGQLVQQGDFNALSQQRGSPFATLLATRRQEI